MQKYKLSRKVSKHFEFIIPMTVISQQFGATKAYSNGDLTITGVGYYFRNEDPENSFSYDVDDVFFEGKNIKAVFEWMEGSIKEVEEIHNACMAHVQGLFSEEAERERDEDLELLETIGNALNPLI